MVRFLTSHRRQDTADASPQLSRLLFLLSSMRALVRAYLSLSGEGVKVYAGRRTESPQEQGCEGFYFPHSGRTTSPIHIPQVNEDEAQVRRATRKRFGGFTMPSGFAKLALARIVPFTRHYPVSLPHQRPAEATKIAIDH